MSFTNFGFDRKINNAIEGCGYDVPTPIQKEAIPQVMNGRDVMGLAQTGTGKTAAFVLPMLQKLLKGPRRKVRALVVAPTRELAEQIHANIAALGSRTGLRSVAVYGGVGKGGQLKMFRSGVEIVVACPGRLLDHLDSKDLRLDGVEMLVLDEADMMFDMGFLPAIKRILNYLPRKRQNLLFSATMPDAIRDLANRILVDPVTVQINHSKPADTVAHVLMQVEQQGKTALLKSLIKEAGKESALVFTRTKYKARNLAVTLEKAGHRAVALQGNMSQNKRKEALDGFRQGRFNILVATDIAARGIDVSGISRVINYDVPDTVEAYTHRIGRTGRAQCLGEAITFAGRDDFGFIRQVETRLNGRMICRNFEVNEVEEGCDTAPPTGRTVAVGEKRDVRRNRPHGVDRSGVAREASRRGKNRTGQPEKRDDRAKGRRGGSLELVPNRKVRSREATPSSAFEAESAMREDRERAMRQRTPAAKAVTTDLNSGRRRRDASSVFGLRRRAHR